MRTEYSLYDDGQTLRLLPREGTGPTVTVEYDDRPALYHVTVTGAPVADDRRLEERIRHHVQHWTAAGVLGPACLDHRVTFR